jgi:hypothetical protein
MENWQVADYQYGKRVELWLTGGKLHIGRENFPGANFSTCSLLVSIHKVATNVEVP